MRSVAKILGRIGAMRKNAHGGTKARILHPLGFAVFVILVMISPILMIMNDVGPKTIAKDIAEMFCWW